MDKPSFRAFFARAPKAELKSTQSQADAGEAEAQFSLGLKYASGAGAAQDYLQAAHWYGKAADQNHAIAQFNLGIMFAGGQGVGKDDAQAGVWFGKAARQGHAGAQFNLGLRQRKASYHGLPEEKAESRVEAYKWFQLASAQGYRGSSEAFEGLAMGLSWDQVRDGNQRVAAYNTTGIDPSLS